jgi:hypothetical protein
MNAVSYDVWSLSTDPLSVDIVFVSDTFNVITVDMGFGHRY